MIAVEAQPWKPNVKRLGEARGRKFSEATNGGVTSYDETKLQVPVCLIREGPGNLHDRHWYTREAIMSGPLVFEGKPAFANHPSRIDESSQPERKIQDILGYYRNVHVEEGADGRSMLCATLDLLAPESDLLRHTHALLKKAGGYSEAYPGSVLAGISINADGEDAPAEINGEKWNAVTKFTSAMSADLVTFPAAGGRLLGMLEAAREALASGRKREAQNMVRQAMKDMQASYAKMKSAKGAEEKAVAEAEVEARMMAMDYLIPKDEEPKPEKSAEEMAAEAAASVPPKAQAEAVEAAEETKAAEAMEVRAGSLREAAKILTEKNPEIARKLEGIAGSLSEKTVDFRKLRTKLSEATAQIAYRESVDRARKILSESGLPTGENGVLDERDLWGKSEADQKSIVADRSRLLKHLEAKISGTGPKIEGAGERMIVEKGTDDGLVARMREAALPLAKK